MTDERMNGDYLRIRNREKHNGFHVERLRASNRSEFDQKNYRRWHVMFAMHEGERVRILIPMTLVPGQEEPFRAPCLMGMTGGQTRMQKMEWVENPHKDRDGEPPVLKEWTTFKAGCDHPIIGPMCVLIEPTVLWDVVEEDGKQLVKPMWEADVTRDGVHDPSSIEAALDGMRSELDDLKTEVAELEEEICNAERGSEAEAAVQRVIDRKRKEIEEQERSIQTLKANYEQRTGERLPD